MLSKYIDAENIATLNEFMEKNLTDKRRVHIKGVISEANKLSLRWNVDKDKACIAAFCHDIMRKPGKENNLTHGNDAAEVMEKQYSITDKEILDAVKYHTTGRENMTMLDMVIYIADSIEPNRRYKGVKHLRELAYLDIEKACLTALQNTIKYTKSKNLFLDNRTALAASDLEKKIQSRGKR